MPDPLINLLAGTPLGRKPNGRGGPSLIQLRKQTNKASANKASERQRNIKLLSGIKKANNTLNTVLLEAYAALRNFKKIKKPTPEQLKKLEAAVIAAKNAARFLNLQ